MPDDPMDRPPVGDRGSDRYDYVEVCWDGVPEHTRLPMWLTPDYMPCPDCRANLFLSWRDGTWYSVFAHDSGCPMLAQRESDMALMLAGSIMGLMQVAVRGPGLLVPIEHLYTGGAGGAIAPWIVATTPDGIKLKITVEVMDPQAD